MKALQGPGQPVAEERRVPHSGPCLWGPGNAVGQVASCAHLGAPVCCQQPRASRLLGVWLRLRAPQPRELPQIGEARALYNIGNVYHAKGKQLAWSTAQDPGHLPAEVRETLRRASEFYE